MKRISLLGAVGMAALGVSFARAQAPAEEKLSPAQIKSTVDSNVGAIKECLKGQPVEGKLVLIFGVMPSGKPEDVKVKHASSNPAVDKCIAGAFRKFSFPKRTAGPFQGVEYPLMFSPPKEEKGNPEEQKQLEQVVVDHMYQVRSCYEDGLLKKSDLAGVLNTAIVIGPSGKVSEAKIVDNSLKDAAVEKCITDAIKSWQFPKHTGDVTINYPFVLKRENKKK
jgi:hypothetical protein